MLQPAQISDYPKTETKLAGRKDFPIYRNISKNGGINAFSSTKYFKTGLLQSQRFAKTKQGIFDELYVNGRKVGWVNQKFFLRNEISVAKHISLVRNPYYNFPTQDAIAYLVNKNGTLINPNQVKVSQSQISSAEPGNYRISFHYKNLVTYAHVQVRNNLNEGITVADKIPIPGPKESKSFTGSSRSSSKNWNYENGYQPETEINKYNGNNSHTMKTRFYQPRFHLLDYYDNSELDQVGVIPEGINLFNNHLLVSYFSQPNSSHGHLVTYNLNKLIDPIQSQNLLTMSWTDFKRTSQNISVSPYLNLGHGQSLGMTKKYIYVLANDNKEANSANSEILLQISRKNYQIKHLWTLKVWNHSSYFPRYFHNAYIINSHLMYAVFHNASKTSYEYWRLTRQGNSWTPTEISATQSNFVNNQSPLQGFTYANNHFFLAFNDNLFMVNRSGKVLKHYHFHTLRETEGVAIRKNQPYIELARRPELLKVN
ncbi:hypothetical protein FC39_GL001243 [Lactobacillus hamsteri DSM 5661 = JCM 6256]|uniref:GW domain-containing protein n=1 Tax=Lactobacillus hamsteri DSM 5661 = JCM 6256 TaxID=1423754 RepID=A0A0R1Y7Z0_9LACO|nr:hypothetical protein FC39_GL001243 [Lactobacillus hamsteri DSM 5661 = JCM 6256]